MIKPSSNVRTDPIFLFIFFVHKRSRLSVFLRLCSPLSVANDPLINYYSDNLSLFLLLLFTLASCLCFLTFLNWLSWVVHLASHSLIQPEETMSSSMVFIIIFCRHVRLSVVLQYRKVMIADDFFCIFIYLICYTSLL